MNKKLRKERQYIKKNPVKMLKLKKERLKNIRAHVNNEENKRKNQ